jgi:peroxiredoxin
MVAALAAERLWNEHPDTRPNVGTKISLPGVDWSKSRQSLVLALSTTCHFCSESADFYSKLVPAAEGNGIRVVAVLPQPLSASRTYLDGLGVSVPDILQSSLDSIEVTGTPTVLLIDAKGKIQKAWVGKVSAKREEEVMEALH